MTLAAAVSASSRLHVASSWISPVNFKSLISRVGSGGSVGSADSIGSPAPVGSAGSVGSADSIGSVASVGSGGSDWFEVEELDAVDVLLVGPGRGPPA